MEELEFPDGFLWGSATSAHQVEGNNTNSDWWQWEHSDHRIRDLQKQNKNPEDYQSGIACDSYNRYEEDFDLLVELNQNAHRISIEWARVQPQKDSFDTDAIEHYRKVLEALKRRNIKTFVTLHHFTNPIWFAEIGGWEKSDNVRYFVDYSKYVLQELGNLIDFICVINEPNVYSLASYFGGEWPPNKKNVILSYEVQQNMVDAHLQVYQWKKLHCPDLVLGTASAIFEIEMAGVLKLFKKLANRFDYAGQFKQLIEHSDFIGINYYTRHRFKFTFKWPFIVREIRYPTTDFGWEVYPQGLLTALRKLKHYSTPIYITENGISDAEDKRRAKFILQHLQIVHQATREGVDIRGYLHWSLIDNFEWAEAFTKEFGLVHIDRKNNLKREIRPSARFYAEICKSNKLKINS